MHACIYTRGTHTGMMTRKHAHTRCQGCWSTPKGKRVSNCERRTPSGILTNSVRACPICPRTCASCQLQLSLPSCTRAQLHAGTQQVQSYSRAIAEHRCCTGTQALTSLGGGCSQGHTDAQCSPCPVLAILSARHHPASMRSRVHADSTPTHTREHTHTHTHTHTLTGALMHARAGLGRTAWLPGTRGERG